MREKILLGIGLLILLLVLLFLFFRPEDTDAPTDPGATVPLEEDAMVRDAASQSAAESILLTPSDIGPDWITERELYERSGQAYDKPTFDVPTAPIDPGIEDPDTRCSVAHLIGVADGVKLGQASSLLSSQGQDDGGFVTTAAAVFPAEENAVARFDAYVDALRKCPDELRAGIDDTNALPGLETRIDVEEIDVPAGAYGLRTRSGFGAIDFGASEQTSVVVRRARMIAGIDITSLGRGTQDVEALAILITERLERAQASLPEGLPAVPIFSADPLSQEAAIGALTVVADYPEVWREVAAPVVVTLEPGTGTVQLGSGVKLFIIEDSPACAAKRLAVGLGVLARAGTGLMKVGRDHYVWHYAAAYESEDAAREAAARVIQGNRTCDEQTAAQQTADLTWKALPLSGFQASDHIEAGVSTWHMEAHAGFPARDEVSTWLSAVIRRGRMLTTLEFTADGEDVAAAEEAMRLVTGRLDDAVATLD